MEQTIPCQSPRLWTPQVSLTSGRNWDKAWAHSPRCHLHSDCKETGPGKGALGEASPLGSSRMGSKGVKSYQLLLPSRHSPETLTCSPR